MTMRAQGFFNLTLQACKNLGPTSGAQIFDWVKRNGELSEAQLTELHGETQQTKLEYTLGWARTDLKRMGYLEQPQRGIWQLTPKALAANLTVPEGELPAPSEPREKNIAEKPDLSTVVHPQFEPLQFGSVTVPVYVDFYDLIGFVKNFTAEENAEVLRVSGLPAPKGVPKELVKRTVFELVSFKWQQLTTGGLAPVSGSKFLDEKLVKYRAAAGKEPVPGDRSAKKLQNVVNRLLRVAKDAQLGIFIGVHPGGLDLQGFGTTFSNMSDGALLAILSDEVEKRDAAHETPEPCEAGQAF